LAVARLGLNAITLPVRGAERTLRVRPASNLSFLSRSAPVLRAGIGAVGSATLCEGGVVFRDRDVLFEQAALPTDVAIVPLKTAHTGRGGCIRRVNVGLPLVGVAIRLSVPGRSRFAFLKRRPRRASFHGALLRLGDNLSLSRSRKFVTALLELSFCFVLFLADLRGVWQLQRHRSLSGPEI
jgi:hypothetical protein